MESVSEERFIVNKSVAVSYKRTAATLQVALTALEGVKLYRTSGKLVYVFWFSTLSMPLNRLRNEKMKRN
jgi:hypothetical protein